MRELKEEEPRAVRDGLDEETLAIFDLLKKPALSQAEAVCVKAIAGELLATLNGEKLSIDR